MNEDESLCALRSANPRNDAAFDASIAGYEPLSAQITAGKPGEPRPLRRRRRLIAVSLAGAALVLVAVLFGISPGGGNNVQNASAAEAIQKAVIKTATIDLSARGDWEYDLSRGWFTPDITMTQWAWWRGSDFDFAFGGDHRTGGEARLIGHDLYTQTWLDGATHWIHYDVDDPNVPSRFKIDLAAVRDGVDGTTQRSMGEIAEAMKDPWVWVTDARTGYTVYRGTVDRQVILDANGLERWIGPDIQPALGPNETVQVQVEVYKGLVVGLSTRYIASDGQKWTATVFISGPDSCMDCGLGSRGATGITAPNPNNVFEGKLVARRVTGSASLAPSKVVEGK
jgi:hypothetical protein